MGETHLKSRWSDARAAEYVRRYAARWGEDLALRTYTSQLLGQEPSLVLHGGGNSSVKCAAATLLGETRPALYVKASGRDMALIGPEEHVGLDLDALRKLRAIGGLSDEEMGCELALHRVRGPAVAAAGAAPGVAGGPAAPVAVAPARVTGRPPATVAGGAVADAAGKPAATLGGGAPAGLTGGAADLTLTASIETLAHAFLPPPYIDHTHADAVLTLTNQKGGEALAREALGEDVIVLEYVHPGFDLALAAAAAYEAHPRARAMVWSRHGLVSWGGSARESYETMLEIVTRAENWIEAKIATSTRPPAAPRSNPERAGSEGALAGSAPARGDEEPDDSVRTRLSALAPVLRGLLARPSGDTDRPHARVVLAPLVESAIRQIVDAPGAKGLLVTPPLTTDHLIRTKALPLWIDEPAYADATKLREQLAGGIAAYASAYEAYLARHAQTMPEGMRPFDPFPRVILLPGLGAICAGPDLAAARSARDITAHTLAVKARIAAMGGVYKAPDEDHLFRMEYRALQHGKLGRPGADWTSARRSRAGTLQAGLPQGDSMEQGLSDGTGPPRGRGLVADERTAPDSDLAGRGGSAGPGGSGTIPRTMLSQSEGVPCGHARSLVNGGVARQGEREGAFPLTGQVALVTGAAGAIGSGICRALLENGCLVAATDLPGAKLDGFVAELGETCGARLLGLPLDVTNRDSVADGFRRVAREWGGVDILIINAGIALVATLAEMDPEDFRRLARVNIEGAVHLLGEAARHFQRQGTGGDIVLVSTKNVFSPGAGFGGYSATKAAAHQLARIASLEMAPLDVRVNMIAPDAVFSDGARRSGLWEEIGPERMRARGLDAQGLEEYYRGRNLLKARITARHVARAVLFFATRQAPITGVTLPVDGGLPDATPR